MKFLTVALIVGALILISGILGNKQRKKTISRGNKQVSGDHKVINPPDKSYSAIDSYFGRTQ
jgi:hypothetical protein